MQHRQFRAGDRVLVRSPEELLATLDADGTLDGLPLMPEMLDWCGKPFRVMRRVEKTCVDMPPPDWGARRRFVSNDVVILDGPRCDGHGHDGCKRGCRVFWREAWLRPVDAEGEPTEPVESGLAELSARLKVKSDEDHYFCQSTELSKVTEFFPGRRKFWWIRVPFSEVRSGDLSVSGVFKLCVLWCGQRLREARTGRQDFCGPHTQTPKESLGLKPGDMVRVKSSAQVAETLDQNSRNRGMSIWPKAVEGWKGSAVVRDRVDKIIDERTGKMRKVNDTVSLQSMGDDPLPCDECLCPGQLGDCPRGELTYWREIWLERVNSDGTTASAEMSLKQT